VIKSLKNLNYIYNERGWIGPGGERWKENPDISDGTGL